MKYFRSLVLPVLAGSALLLAAAFGQQPGPTPNDPSKAPATPPPPSLTLAKADPEAAKLLDTAVKQLDPKKVSWIETHLWQQAEVQGLSFQAEGDYYTAPGDRMHMTLQVRLGGTIGTTESICDGKYCWRIIQVGKGDRVILKEADLKQAQEILKNPAVGEEVQAELFRSLAFHGVVPLLETIQKQMIVTGQEKVRLGHREMTRLTARWNDDIAKSIAASDKAWPPSLPRQLRLYLVRLPKDVLWPYRLEWWGPATPGGDDALIYQMEFRSPKVNQEMPAEQAAKIFSFDPGNAEVRDITKQHAETVRKRVQDLAALKKQQAKPPENAPAGKP